MRIVIVGDGKVGITLTQRLALEGHDLVIIDHNRRVLQETAAKYDVIGIVGNGASLKTQQEAEVEKADLLIAASSADEVNLLCCILAKKLGVKRSIARVRNPEYTEQLALLKKDLGLSMTINPELAAANEMLNLIHFPAALKRETFAKGRAEIIELKLNKGNILCGKFLRELYPLTKLHVLVCAVERGNEVFIPSGDFQLRTGDSIYVTGTYRNLAAFVQKLDFAEKKIRNVMLVGGSRIAYYLARALLAEDYNVKILEMDAKRCEELAADLPGAQIIHADGTQTEVLDAEGIEDADAFITMTDLDEVNIVLSMYAKQLGVYKVITKINRMEYDDLATRMEVESIVTPKDIVCNDIVAYVRAMENTSISSVLSLHRLVQDKVEALEFSVTDRTRHLEVPLKDLPIKPGILLACISRSGRIIIPGGNDVLRQEDTVVIVTTSDRMYSNLNEIFE